MSDIICSESREDCQNGGACIILPDPTLNFCKCPEGFVGAKCHGTINNISVCTPSGGECLNGGTCIMANELIGGKETAANYCDCPDNNLFGSTCRSDNDPAPPNAPSQLAQAAQAAAKEEFEGELICTAFGNQCQNGGTCELSSATVPANYCKCTDGFIGNRCHSAVKENTGPNSDTVTTTTTGSTTSTTTSGAHSSETNTNSIGALTGVEVGGVVCTANGGECLNGSSCILKALNQEIPANYCKCEEGYFGEVCKGKHSDQIPTSEICTPEGGQCQNGSSCITKESIPDLTANYCECKEGYFGGLCHGKHSNNTPSEICTPEGGQCQNGSSCITKESSPDLTANYCECKEGYFGGLCHGKHSNNTPSEICTIEGGECKNGAFCVLKESSPDISANYCECTDGHFGQFCGGKHSNNTPPPQPSPGIDWGDGATPTNNNSGKAKEALCTAEWNPCQNGGLCVTGTNQQTGDPSYSCSCPDGTSGALCEAVDACDLECQHGGSCRHYDNNGRAGFECECAGSYKGVSCEIPFTKCPTTVEGFVMECLYGGDCIFDDDASLYKCSCPKGRSGDRCEIGTQSTIDDYNGPCFADAECFNGGLCVRAHDAEATAESGMLTKATTCLCATQYGGDNCEYKCESLNCQHGSSCRFQDEDISHANDAAESGAYCDCKDDSYKGIECEIAVMKCPGDNGMECLYGGSCIGSEDDADGNFYTCACPPGRTGTRCQNRDPSFGSSGGSINGPDRSNYLPPKMSTFQTRSNIDPNMLLIAIITFFVLMIVPLTLLCLGKHRRKKNAAADADAQVTVTESIDDGIDVAIANGTHVANPAEGADSDDIFDYDMSGVVNVDLDENEPVPLPKDKQIV